MYLIYSLRHTILNAIFMLLWIYTQKCSNKSIYNIDQKQNKILRDMDTFKI